MGRYRTRAHGECPRRWVYYIDINGVPLEAGAPVNLNYSPLSTEEDIFVPVRDPGPPSQILRAMEKEDTSFWQWLGSAVSV